MAGTPANSRSGSASSLADVLAIGAAANSVTITGLGAPSGAADADTLGARNTAIAAAVGGVGWTTVTKASDESVTGSTVLQNDDELLFTAASGGAYEFQALIIYASPAGATTPDIKIGFGEDATVRGTYAATYLDETDSSAISTNTARTGNSIILGTGAANRTVYVMGSYIGGGGVLHMFWAQATSDANATTVRAGSVLRYRRVL